MSERTHANHDHSHGKQCGHTAVQHEDHVDYLHEGHLHHQKNGVVEEHSLAVTNINPTQCTGGHVCSGHDAKHVHGPSCGHESVPHGDHVDYLVNGHLHHSHDGHCDNHGAVKLV